MIRLYFRDQELLKHLKKYYEIILDGKHKELQVDLFKKIFTNIANYQTIIEAALAPVLVKIKQEKAEVEQKIIEARSAKQTAERATQTLEAENAELRRKLAAAIEAVAKMQCGGMNIKKRELDENTVDESLTDSISTSWSGMFSTVVPPKKPRAFSSDNFKIPKN